MPDARSIKNERARRFVGKETGLRERMSKEAEQLDKVVGKLRDCQARREAAEADETPLVRQDGYGSWWADAWDALHAAKPLLDRKKDFALHFAHDPGLGEDLETLTRKFEEVLPVEREQRRRVLAERVDEEHQEQRQRMSRDRGFRM